MKMKRSGAVILALGGLFAALALPNFGFLTARVARLQILFDGADVDVSEPLVSTIRAGELAQFKIQICHAPTCVEVMAEQGRVGIDGRSVSAHNAQIKIESLQSKSAQRPRGFSKSTAVVRRKDQRISCAELRFDLKDQFIVCDNRQLEKTASITLDSNFKVQTY